jgi:hypothetical protein
MESPIGESTAAFFSTEEFDNPFPALTADIMGLRLEDNDRYGMLIVSTFNMFMSRFVSLMRFPPDKLWNGEEQQDFHVVCLYMEIVKFHLFLTADSNRFSCSS